MAQFVDGLNAKINKLLVALEGKTPGVYLVETVGADLMEYITSWGMTFNTGGRGLVYIAIAALRGFAMTHLREETKKPSSVPFNPAEFERERAISRIIDDIMRGPRRTG